MRASSPEELLGRTGWVRALARRLVRDPGAAEDVVQETLLAALRRPADAPPPARGWLAKVAKSAARQRRRGERARARRERSVAVPEPLPSPEELSARVECQRLVVDAVGRLAEPLRSTVLLRYFDGIPAAEIARRQHLPPGTVRWRLKRAMGLLREDLDRRHGGDGAAWVSALAPLVAPSGAPAGTVATGGLAAVTLGGLMGLKGWIVAAAAAALAGGAIWMAAGGSEPLAPAVAGTGRPPALEVPAAAPPAGEPLGAAASDAGERVAASADEGRASAGGEARVRGRVAVAGGVGPGEELEVFALRVPIDYPRFAHSHDREPWDEDHAELLGSLVLARGPVDAAGRFDLAVPGHDGRAHLMLRGRHLYLPASREVVVPGPDVELSASRGALLAVELSAPPGHRLEGVRVEVATDRGLADAPLAVDLDHRCAGDGRFVARALPEGARYTVLVEPDPPLAAALARIAAPGSGADVTAAVALDEGGGVAGEVVDGDGRPIPDARVCALLVDGPFGARSREVREAATDGSGRFELDAVPAGRVALRAEKPGLLETKRVEVDVPAGGTLGGVSLELAEGRALAGRVAWPDGTPARDVVVRASFDRGWSFGPTAFGAFRGAEGTARTDADGAFRVTGLGGGPFVVTAGAERADATHRARRDGVQPGNGELALVLHAPLALCGRAVDESGRPLERFDVLAVRVAQGEIGAVASERREARFEETAGELSLEGLEEGEWRLEATAEGRVTLEPLTAVLPAAADARLLFVLHPAATVRGRVVSTGGQPVAGAVVRADRGLTPMQVLHSGLPLGPRAESDGEGRFELAGLPPRALELFASAEGHVPSAPAALQLAAGSTVEDVLLVLGAGAVLTAEVYDDHGEPAAGREVHVVQWSQGTSAAHHARTGDDGRFRLDAIPAGTWTVVVIDPARDVAAEDDGASFGNVMKALQFREVVLRDGETTHVVIGSAPEHPVRVFGRVSQGGDSPGELLVHFHPTSGGLFTGVVSTVTGGDGTYECTLPRPGSWIVAIELPARRMGDERIVEHRRDVPGGSDARLDFELPTGRLSGVVLGPDGDPAAAARISLTPVEPPRTDQIWGGQYAETATDPDGRFEVSGLSAGRYRLTAGGPPLLDPEAEVPWARLARDLELAEAEHLRGLELALAAPGSVRARVLGPDGAPFPNATLFARAADGAPVDGFSMLTTDDEGVATLRGLAPGPTTLFARSGSLASPESDPVEVRPGAESEVLLCLEDAAHVVVRLRGPDGPTPAVLRVIDPEGRDVGSFFAWEDLAHAEAATGDFDGATTRVGPLVAGTYTLTATAEGGLSAERELALEGGAERTVTLRMKR